MNYLLNQPTVKRARQSEPIPNRESEMIQNNAGGFAFKADSWTVMERFLILGSEGGTYYVSETDLTKRNVDNVRACIEQDGLKAVQMIVEISKAGRAPKNDPALYALALAASSKNKETRQAALRALPEVARTGTYLFTFCSFVNSMRGWGPTLRKGIAKWYTEKTENDLAYQLAKYRQRNGWTHRDVLRLCHPTGHNSALYRWATNNNFDDQTLIGPLPRHYANTPNELPRIIQGMELCTKATAKETVSLIREYGLTREMIPTEAQTSAEVWEALLEKMPMTAMIRTLGRMGAVGLLVPFSNASAEVCNRLADPERLRKSKIHPIQVLLALMTYKQGHGEKGKLSWTPVPQVVDALNGAFYASFANAKPLNKRIYVGVDVSGSMTSGAVAGAGQLTPNMGAAAIAMLIVRKELSYFVGGFSDIFVDLGLTANDTLDVAMRKCQMSYGATDCAIAIRHAYDNKFLVDAFVVITDGETWAGDKHTCQVLQEYRQKLGIDSKLIVINMVANRTSIADPEDKGSLDVIGFDASVPQIIEEFFR